MKFFKVIGNIIALPIKVTKDMVEGVVEKVTEEEDN